MCSWSCNKPNAPDCFQKAGDPAVEIRQIAGEISTLVLTDYIHLVLAPADGPPHLKVEAPINLLPELVTTHSSDGRLTIQNDNTCNFMRRYDHLLRVTVYADITHVINRGTGNISTLAPLNVSDFLLENRDASGEVTLHFDDAELVVIKDHTGVAEVTVAGQSDTVELFNQGWGKLDASGLFTQTALTNNSSIGELRVHASNYLYASLSSTGDVIYFGAPGTIDSDLSGSGELVSGD